MVWLVIMVQLKVDGMWDCISQAAAIEINGNNSDSFLQELYTSLVAALARGPHLNHLVLKSLIPFRFIIII